MTPLLRFPKPYADFVQRLRVPFGFVLLITFATLSKPNPASMLLGMPVCVAGLALRAWAAGHLAKDRHLATSGPYAHIRNPLYAGTLLVALGIVLAARDAWLAAIFAVVFLGVYLPAIQLEEQHLSEIFPEYSAYAARVRRLLPVAKWQGGEDRFSRALYMRNQEYKALIGFVFAAAWLAFRCWMPHGLH